MRIWGVPVACMCNKHLRGEHVEMHMFKSVIESGKSVGGYIRDKLLDTHGIIQRHDRVAAEMVRRGDKHVSPLEWIHYPEGFEQRTSVIPTESEMELARRCTDCRKRFEEYYGAEKFAHIPIGGDGIVPDRDGYAVKYNGKIIADSFPRRDKAVTHLERHRRKLRAQ